MGSEQGRGTHRHTLWKMVVVAMQNRAGGKQTWRQKEGGAVAQWQSPGEQAQEPGSNLWYCQNKQTNKKADIQRVDFSPQRWNRTNGSKHGEEKFQASGFSDQDPQGWLLLPQSVCGTRARAERGESLGLYSAPVSVSIAVGCFLPLDSETKVEAVSWF